MNKDYSHVTIVLDRSGSMSSCKTDMEGGLRSFIESQKKLDGKCTVSYYTFDGVFETEFEFKDVQDIKESDLILEPRGMTALRDGVGNAINLTGAALREMEEKDRPALVTMLVITDGGENASQEFNASQLQSMVKEQENKYNWEFSYLGANQDAFAQSSSMGFKAANVSNFDTSNSQQVFDSYSLKMMGARGATSRSEKVDMSYDDKERSDFVK